MHLELQTSLATETNTFTTSYYGCIAPVVLETQSSSRLEGTVFQPPLGVQNISGAAGGLQPSFCLNEYSLTGDLQDCFPEQEHLGQTTYLGL